MFSAKYSGRQGCAWLSAIVGGLSFTAAPLHGVLAEECASTEPASQEAIDSAEMAGTFLLDHASVAGGYVYAWSEDLSVRSGEGGVVEDGVVWNQSPGTPAVGAAYLVLNKLTGDPRWANAAATVAESLRSGQLASGGWFNFTETEPDARKRWCYRQDGTTGGACASIGGNEPRNRGSLDDNITQGILGFLLWYVSTAGVEDAAAQETIDYALEHLLAAQYPNGAWPVFLDRVYPHREFAAAWRARSAGILAKIPENAKDPTYLLDRDAVEAPYLVVNDHVVRDVIRLLLAAERRLGRPDLLASAMRSGDFLLAAQLPEPQRGWAQTYDADLKPVWGRAFEPPAVASRETAGAMEALLQLYVRTSRPRYLEGALEAAKWLEKSRLPSGLWARFYEIGAGRPVYVRANGDLSYDDDDLWQGYSLVGGFGIDGSLDLARRVAAGEKPSVFDSWDWVFEPLACPGDALRRLVELQDEAGRVVEDGWIRSETFVSAVRDLARRSEGARP